MSTPNFSEKKNKEEISSSCCGSCASANLDLSKLKSKKQHNKRGHFGGQISSVSLFPAKQSRLNKDQRQVFLLTQHSSQEPREDSSQDSIAAWDELTDCEVSVTRYNGREEYCVAVLWFFHSFVFALFLFLIILHFSYPFRVTLIYFCHLHSFWGHPVRSGCNLEYKRKSSILYCLFTVH